jgi:hypothetical protein
MSVTKIYRRDNQPFAQIPNEAIRDPRITPNAFRLLAYLMSHQDGYELTYLQIERETTLGRYAINQAAECLTLLGWLAVDRPKAANGQFGAKSWTVLTPTATSVGHSTMERLHLEQPTDNKKTTSLEDKELRTVNPQAALEDVSFDEFWKVYPLKRDKQAARKALRTALKTTSLEEIVEGARRYAEDPNRSEKFTKYPATWLNAGSWADGPLPERERTPEEKAAEAKAKYERDRQAAIEASRRQREESEAARRAAEANPPAYCEHGRVKVICRKCPAPQVA